MICCATPSASAVTSGSLWACVFSAMDGAAAPAAIAVGSDLRNARRERETRREEAMRKKYISRRPPRLTREVEDAADQVAQAVAHALAMRAVGTHRAYESDGGHRLL